MDTELRFHTQIGIYCSTLSIFETLTLWSTRSGDKKASEKTMTHAASATGGEQAEVVPREPTKCNRGWYGIDCSFPSAILLQDWPRWLRPSTVDVPDMTYTTSVDTSIKAVVKKKRPLIYVYDLPPEFNSHLLEGRHFKFECVNIIYIDQNQTLWTEQLYGSQCNRGWYGIDCSISSAPLLQDWPRWLRPSTVDVPDKAYTTSVDTSIKAVVKKKRPLIYVYNLPPEFNTHLLEGRHFKFECVNRMYIDQNRILWTEKLHGSHVLPNLDSS